MWLLVVNLVDFRDFNDSLDYMLILWLGYAYVMIVFVCECLSLIIWLGYIIKMSQSEQHQQQNEEAQQKTHQDQGQQEETQQEQGQ
jgi:hypothetical protein